VSEVPYHKSLSELEEHLDHLLQLGEGEAIVYRGASVSDNYLDSDAAALPLLSGYQGLTATSTWSGRLGHRKGTKPSKLLDSSPPFFAIDPDELPFQEGRPLDSSNEEEEWITKCSSPDHEVFMAFMEEIPSMEADGLCNTLILKLGA
jgi:hypothetical protein